MSWLPPIRKSMTRPTSDSAAPVRAEDSYGNQPRPARALGEIISIRPNTSTETEDALRESEARLRALLSSLDDLVFELDENGVYLAVWTTNESLLVAPPAELLGHTTREALGDEVGRRVADAVARAQDGPDRDVGVQAGRSSWWSLVSGPNCSDPRLGSSRGLRSGA